MRLLNYLLGLLLLPLTLPAQDTTAVLVPKPAHWKRSFSGGVNFNQASFSGNWKAGGVSSISLGSIVRAKADYNDTGGKVTFSNELEMRYGIVSNADQGSRKSADRIFFDSKFGRKVSGKTNVFVSINFLTQFAPGYKYEKDPQGEEKALIISRFLAPGFLTTSSGLEYKPVKYFWVRFSPVAPRLTFVTDTTLYRNVPTNYGVPIGKQVRFEGVATQLLADYDRNITEKFNVKGRYLAFANLQQFGWNAIDHRLDLALTAKVTKYISMNVAAILLYDKDQDKKLQLSQVLALGFLYTAADKQE